MSTVVSGKTEWPKVLILLLEFPWLRMNLIGHGSLAHLTPHSRHTKACSWSVTSMLQPSLTLTAHCLLMPPLMSINTNGYLIWVSSVLVLLTLLFRILTLLRVMWIWLQLFTTQQWWRSVTPESVCLRLFSLPSLKFYKVSLATFGIAELSTENYVPLPLGAKLSQVVLAHHTI